jgi:hypothetical protein
LVLCRNLRSDPVRAADRERVPEVRRRARAGRGERPALARGFLPALRREVAALRRRHKNVSSKGKTA